jgi:hypothetical protein
MTTCIVRGVVPTQRTVSRFATQRTSRRRLRGFLGVMACAPPRSLKGGAHMGIISWVILGLIAGFIGSKIVDK